MGGKGKGGGEEDAPSVHFHLHSLAVILDPLRGKGGGGEKRLRKGLRKGHPFFFFTRFNLTRNPRRGEGGKKKGKIPKRGKEKGGEEELSGERIRGQVA